MLRRVKGGIEINQDRNKILESREGLGNFDVHLKVLVLPLTAPLTGKSGKTFPSMVFLYYVLDIKREYPSEDRISTSYSIIILLKVYCNSGNSILRRYRRLEQCHPEYESPFPQTTNRRLP